MARRIWSPRLPGVLLLLIAGIMVVSSVPLATPAGDRSENSGVLTMSSPHVSEAKGKFVMSNITDDGGDLDDWNDFQVAEGVAEGDDGVAQHRGISDMSLAGVSVGSASTNSETPVPPRNESIASLFNMPPRANDTKQNRTEHNNADAHAFSNVTWPPSSGSLPLSPAQNTVPIQIPFGVNGTASTPQAQMPSAAMSVNGPESAPSSNRTSSDSPPPKTSTLEFQTEADTPDGSSSYNPDENVDSLEKPFLAQHDQLFSIASQRAYGPAPFEIRYHAMGEEMGSFDVLKQWGQFAPYFSSPMFSELQRYRTVPPHCTIKQVHLLHRHGARLPNSPNAFVKWFHNVTSENRAGRSTKIGKATFSGPLHFLTNWSDKLGKNEMTAAGNQQMFDSGVHAHYHYGGLHEDGKLTHKPIVRTLSQERVLESAQLWAMGYYGSRSSEVVDMEVQKDEFGFNSTLEAMHVCPAAKERRGSKMMNEWVKHYLVRAVERLQHHVHGGAQLDPFVVFGMQNLCPHETYALGMSDFCNLFTRQEWLGFTYSHDLLFQGNSGFMSPTGRAQGIGWVQELVARMMHSSIETPLTSQNRTLDSNQTTFPLDQAFFADFTHGGQIVSVLAALNFSQLATELDSRRMDDARNFVSSHIIPFAARFYVEVLTCNEEDVSESHDAHKHYVRFLLNDALLPVSHLQGCANHFGQYDGLCDLGAFVEHVNKNVVPAANFIDACYANLAQRTAPTEDEHMANANAANKTVKAV